MQQVSSWDSEDSPLLEGTPISMSDLVSPGQGEGVNVRPQQVASHWTLP